MDPTLESMRITHVRSSPAPRIYSTRRNSIQTLDSITSPLVSRRPSISSQKALDASSLSNTGKKGSRAKKTKKGKSKKSGESSDSGSDGEQSTVRVTVLSTESSALFKSAYPNPILHEPSTSLSLSSPHVFPSRSPRHKSALSSSDGRDYIKETGGEGPLRKRVAIIPSAETATADSGNGPSNLLSPADFFMAEELLLRRLKREPGAGEDLDRMKLVRMWSTPSPHSSACSGSKDPPPLSLLPEEPLERCSRKCDSDHHVKRSGSFVGPIRLGHAKTSRMHGQFKKRDSEGKMDLVEAKSRLLVNSARLQRKSQPISTCKATLLSSQGSSSPVPDAVRLQKKHSQSTIHPPAPPVITNSTVRTTTHVTSPSLQSKDSQSPAVIMKTITTTTTTTTIITIPSQQHDSISGNNSTSLSPSSSACQSPSFGSTGSVGSSSLLLPYTMPPAALSNPPLPAPSRVVGRDSSHYYMPTKTTRNSVGTPLSRRNSLNVIERAISKLSNDTIGGWDIASEMDMEEEQAQWPRPGNYLLTDLSIDVLYYLVKSVPPEDLPFLAMSCKLLYQLCSPRLHRDNLQNINRFADICLTSPKRWRWASRLHLRMPCWLRDEDLTDLCAPRHRVKYFDLRNCIHITDVGLKVFRDMQTEVVHLDLRKNEHVSNMGLKCLRHAPLRHLNLECNGKITDKGFEFLGKACKHLRVLNLRRNELVTDTALLLLSNARAPLEVLNLASALNITDVGLSYLADAFTPLRTLILSSNTAITDEGLCYLGRGGVPLSVLDLQSNTNLTDVGLKALTDATAPLKELDIRRSKITDTGMAYLGDSKAPLKSLHLDWNEEITDQGLVMLCKGRPPLEELCLRVNKNVSNAGLKALAECRTPIRILALDVNERVDDEGLKMLGNAQTPLVHLNLHFNGKVTDAGIKAICEGGAKLEMLYLGFNKLLTDQAMVSLSKAGSNLSMIDLRSNCNISCRGIMHFIENECPLKWLRLSSDNPDFTKDNIKAVTEASNCKLRVTLSPNLA